MQREHAAVEMKNIFKNISVDGEPFARNANEEKPLALHAGKVRWTTDCISVQESGAGQTLAHTCPRTRGKKEWDVAKDTQRNATASIY